MSQQKKCNKCEIIKELDYFHKSARNLFGRHPTCKDCRSNKSADKEKKERPSNDTEVYCNGCKTKLKASNFATSSRSKSGLQSACKKCKGSDQASRNSILDNFIKKKILDTKNNANNRRKEIKFNITCEDVIGLYKANKGLCSISGEKMTHLATVGIAKNGKIKHPNNISIDRIDPDGYYDKDNIQLVCNTLNRSRWEIDMDDMIDTFLNVKNHNNL
tara:strand:- start:353 stop:1003 length:651 start_codon:yes stop_codon:yes gene_type:complete